MRIQIAYKGLEKKDKKAFKPLINEKTADLEKRLGTFANGDVSLRGTLEKNSKHNLYRFGATLHLPHKIIAAEEEADNAHEAISKTFEELDRQAQRYKSRVKNEHLWKRTRRRKQLKNKFIEATGGSSSQPIIQSSADWFESIRPSLDDLYHFAMHEITYLQALGDLMPDDILPDELVDAVLVTAFEQQERKPEKLDTRAWLLQLAIEQLEKEVEESLERRKAISTETVIPDEDIDTNLYEFYQPDEVLKLIDLIGVSDAVPEAERAAALAEQEAALPALSDLPRDWRRAAILHYTMGLPVEDVATVMKIDRDRIEELLSLAERYIADRTRSNELPEGARIARVLEVSIRQTLTETSLDEFRNKFQGD